MPANPLVKRRVNDSGESASGSQIMVSPGGDVLVTWYAPGRFARVLDEDGNLLSAKIAFPTATGTAAWIDPDEFAILSGDEGISIQRYDRTGATVGGSIAVAAGGKADDLALLASGNVVATYRVGSEIRGRILDSALSPTGADFLIYDVGTNGFGETIVTPLTGGGFAFTVVVGGGGDGSLERVAMFDGSGSKTASISPGVIQRPDVVALPDGGLVLTTSDLATGTIRFYNADGTVRAQSTWEQLGQQGAVDPDVTLLGTEIVLVAYEHRIKTGDYSYVFALYSLDGRPLRGGSLGSLHGAATFDVDATGAASFVTVEHSSTGSNADTTVTYWELDNIVFGTAGDDVLSALDGTRILVGREGNDLFFIDSSADDIVERANQGDSDRVLTSDDYVVPEGLAVEILSTDQNFGTSPIDLTGNEFTQYIYGNNGHNVIRGRHGGGAVMTGFEGNDTYYVDHENDQVREEQYSISNTQDRVIASVSWVLGAGQEVEFITTSNVAATTPLYLIANELDGQTVTGNAGNNTLDGGGGQNDVMIGLGGDDTYIVREAGDHIQEVAGGGFDRVMALTSYTLQGAEIEILATIDPLATTAIDLIGNAFAQYLYGNAGVNRLNGNGGGDVLTGLGGDDLYDIVDIADEIREVAGGGGDRLYAAVSYVLNEAAQVEIVSTIDNLATTALNLTGNELAQYVYGNAGSNTLGGGAGRDVLTGLGGSDFFLFDSALNTGFTGSFNTLGESANVDRIDGFGVDDKIQLKGSLFGLTPGALPAGAFNSGTTATDADDRVLYDTASGALLFDSDGTGAAAAQLIAFISNPFNLDASYIVVM